MGTPNWAATIVDLAKKWILAVALVAMLFSNSALADPSATDRVIQFLTNSYTGRSMQATEWLSQETRRAEKFNAFGGLNALVKQSTARAREFKGLKSVVILDVKQEGQVYIVKAEVKFFEDHRKPTSPAMAEREDIIWDIRVARENSKWKLSL
jgi:hypothetical protein